MATAMSTSNSSSLKTAIGQPLADLEIQIQQWLKFEKQQFGTSRLDEIERTGTVFVVWFSVWDLWYYSERETVDAEVAVKKTMDTMFKQLDTIAENWPLDLKTIVPEAIDLTFLPGWRNIRTTYRGLDSNGEMQKRAIGLVEQWNRALDLRASRWQKGSMYIYNTNEWLLDQVRERQLVNSHISDANGLGNTQSPWSNVSSGCIQTEFAGRDWTDAARCPDPETYLFWSAASIRCCNFPC